VQGAAVGSVSRGLAFVAWGGEIGTAYHGVSRDTLDILGTLGFFSNHPRLISARGLSPDFDGSLTA